MSNLVPTNTAEYRSSGAKRLTLWPLELEVASGFEPLPPGGERGVDSRLRGPGGEWGVQVTRVGTRQRWEDLANGRHVVELLSPSEAADEIWEVISRKFGTGGGILALSVGQSGAHAFADVVSEFRRTYGERVRARIRYSQVWLVGYTPETTVRIYPTN